MLPFFYPQTIELPVQSQTSVPLRDDEHSSPVPEVFNSPSKSSGKGILSYKPLYNLMLCACKASGHCSVDNC